MQIQFWTSTEYSGFMEALIAELNALGHPSRQCFLISEASYRSAKSKHARLLLRVRQYLLYPLHLLASLLFGRARNADILVVCTNTFYAPLLATFLHKRVIHLVYDLFPEAFTSAECGVRNAESTRNIQPATTKPFVTRHSSFDIPSHRLIRAIVRTTLRRAETNVFLGDHLRNYVLSQYPVVRNPVVIPVGAIDLWNDECRMTNDECQMTNDECRETRAECGVRNAECGVTSDECAVHEASKAPDLSSTLSPPVSRIPYPVSGEPASPPVSGEPASPPPALSLLYCGNLGRMHDIDTLLGALRSESRVAETSESRVYAASQRTVYGPGCGTPRSPCPSETAEETASAEAFRVKPPEGGTPNITLSPPVSSEPASPASSTLYPLPSTLYPLPSTLYPPPPVSSEPASPPVSRIPYPVSAREARFLFRCSGPKKPQLVAAVAELPPEIRARIHIGGSLAPADWQRVMQEADIALVTMIPGAEKVVMPSKTYSAMMAEQAILAICPPVSDLADTIHRADCGWVIPPGDDPALLQALHEAQTDPVALRQKQQNARAAALEHYSMPVLAQQWAELWA